MDARYLATCSSDKTCAIWELSEQVMLDNEEENEESKDDKKPKED